jgi:dihydrolipoamide dehydrogenase
MSSYQYDLVVIGGGPGGYTAAFYAADKGLNVALIEASHLGGTCLNVGCIPSKALLNATHVIENAENADSLGISFSKPTIDLGKLREFKNGVVEKLRGGIAQLAKARNVTVYGGLGSFIDASNINIKTQKEDIQIGFNYAIIATGSAPVIPGVFDIKSKNVVDSTGALELEDIPKSFLVIGGGVIGLELGSVYAGLGSEVTVIEALPKLLDGIDKDLVRPLEKHLRKAFKDIHVGSKVLSLEEKGQKILVKFETADGEKEQKFDKVLLSLGRKPITDGLGVENAGVKLDEKGFVKVTNHVNTDTPHIYAIGDVAGNPMLAHKSSREGRIAVEKILGEKSEFDNAIPSVIYTDPEIAWVGLSEAEAKEKGIEAEVGKFPWGASGRALSMNRTDGITKVVIEKKTERILGMGITGVNAGELIAEGVLAVEMGAVLEDITNTIHAHPTLSETVMESFETIHNISTHIAPKRKK